MKKKIITLLLTSLVLTITSLTYTGCSSSTKTTTKPSSTAETSTDENFEILQDENDGEIKGDYYLATTKDNYYWGVQPSKTSQIALKIDSGSSVTIDTLSHEGMLEDQGKDPESYFSRYGITRDSVLNDAIEIASTDTTHNFENNGPHILTSPIYINDAEPGDVLKIEVLDLTPRVPYGVVSNRHYKGALPDEFPENKSKLDTASAANFKDYNNVSTFASIKLIDGEYYGSIDADNKPELNYKLTPFLGTMGLVSNSDEQLSSVPPTAQGGNIDINELGIGSTLYLPVEVEGGLFYTGDPHFAQGDGEVALTAMEGSLRASLRFTLIKNGSDKVPGNKNNFNQAFAETEEYWIPIGLNTDLDEAMKQSVRESVDFINEQFGIERSLAYAYLSAATDYDVSQVVDKVKGIHALIQKSDFINYIKPEINYEDKNYTVNIINENLYVDGEDILKAIGAKTSFNSKTNILSITYNNNTYEMTIDSNKYTSNGKTITMSASPLLQSDKVLIPTASLYKVLGISLNWSTEGSVIIGTLDMK